MQHQLTASLTLMPEWAEQEAVVLAWPNQATDWNPFLEDAQLCFVRLIMCINAAGASVILLCREQDIRLIKQLLPASQPVLLVVVDYNDTWTRDYVFLSCASEQGNIPVEFTFNGWGDKFEADNDNQVNKILSRLCQHALQTCPVVLEGGALEIDENQCLLSTASCLFNPKRNGDMNEAAYQQVFDQYLGAKQSIILHHGHLEGDDTDGHIDTLVRFTPLMGLVMQHARNRTHDPHFEGLFKLQMELQKHFPQHTLYELPLPFVVNEAGERLPASYANFLICNQHVLAPIYNQVEDDEAMKVLQQAYPNHTIVPIDCSVLVKQFGSLHCVTMQIPCGTLAEDVLAQAKSGLTRMEL